MSKYRFIAMLSHFMLPLWLYAQPIINDSTRTLSVDIGMHLILGRNYAQAGQCTIPAACPQPVTWEAMKTAPTLSLHLGLLYHHAFSERFSIKTGIISFQRLINWIAVDEKTPFITTNWSIPILPEVPLLFYFHHKNLLVGGGAYVNSYVFAPVYVTERYRGIYPTIRGAYYININNYFIAPYIATSFRIKDPYYDLHIGVNIPFFGIKNL